MTIDSHVVFNHFPSIDLINVGLNLLEIDPAIFLNVVSEQWDLLPYSKDKAIKKKFRIFKNSSLINAHVRNAFEGKTSLSGKVKFR